MEVNAAMPSTSGRDRRDTPLAVTVLPAARDNRDWFDLLAAATPRLAWRLIYCEVVKRAIDITVAGLLLVLLSPVILLAAVVVRLDSPGPVIFRQRRIGRHGRPFVVYKLRTMAADRKSDDRLVLLPGADGRLRHKVRNDPRVTRAGRLLRRSSIDELPQLVNVLLGQMSLIGPRPELPQIVAEYESWQHQRHLLRPGLTGWWQVQGRSERPMHEHTQLDLYYVAHVSPRLDGMIAIRTIRVLLFGRGAF